MIDDDSIPLSNSPRWIPPLKWWWKGNFDASALGNPDASGIDGLICNSRVLS